MQLGTIFLSIIEPFKDHVVAYNRWYERDHFYSALLAAPHSFAGDRFVATSDLKALRDPVDSTIELPGSVGSYLSLCWIAAGKYQEWNQWSIATAGELRKQGRNFEERRHIHTWPYSYCWSYRPNSRGTPAELALDRGYQGLVVLVGDLCENRTMRQLEKWTADVCSGPDAVLRSAPDLVVCASPVPPPPNVSEGAPRFADPARRFVQLHFLDYEPGSRWSDGYDKLGRLLTASGVAVHLWTAPWKQTVVGTDLYTDELW